MEIKTSKIINIEHLQSALKTNKLVVDANGNVYTLIEIFDIPNKGISVQYKSVNELDRFVLGICEFKKYFRIVDYINVNNFTSTNYINQNNKENKMEGYIERMIQEHKELVVRIDKLHSWVYGDAYKKVNAVEYANECIQLKAMKVYEEALSARLFNAGVTISGNEYLIAIDRIEEEHEEDPGDNN